MDRLSTYTRRALTLSVSDIGYNGIDTPNDNNLNSVERLQETSFHPVVLQPLMDSIKQDLAVEKQTRGCCGGRPLCVNRNLKQTNVMVPKTQGFENWHCSAHQFFLHGNCVNGEYYTNKDCRMKLDQTRGAIATVDTMPAYINTIDQQIKSHSLPNLVCKQKVCLCGTCAPKSHEPETLKKILKIYNLN